MKSSRRSNASSRTSPERTLWLIGVEPYTQETVRLALRDQDVWSLRCVSSVSELSQPSVSVTAASAAVLIPAARADLASAVPPSFPVLLYGSPVHLSLLGELRCNDFLVDPWTADELRYRLEKLVTSQSRTLDCGVVSWGAYWLAAADHSGRTERIALSPSQYAVFDVIARAHDEPVPREALLAVAHLDDGGRALDMQVSRLRSRLAWATASWIRSPSIRAYRGVGYRLENA